MELLRLAPRWPSLLLQPGLRRNRFLQPAKIDLNSEPGEHQRGRLLLFLTLQPNPNRAQPLLSPPSQRQRHQTPASLEGRLPTVHHPLRSDIHLRSSCQSPIPQPHALQVEWAGCPTAITSDQSGCWVWTGNSRTKDAQCPQIHAGSEIQDRGNPEKTNRNRSLRKDLSSLPRRPGSLQPGDHLFARLYDRRRQARALRLPVPRALDSQPSRY